MCAHGDTRPSASDKGPYAVRSTGSAVWLVIFTNPRTPCARPITPNWIRVAGIGLY